MIDHPYGRALHLHNFSCSPTSPAQPSFPCRPDVFLRPHSHIFLPITGTPWHHARSLGLVPSSLLEAVPRVHTAFHYNPSYCTGHPSSRCATIKSTRDSCIIIVWKYHPPSDTPSYQSNVKCSMSQRRLKSASQNFYSRRECSLLKRFVTHRVTFSGMYVRMTGFKTCSRTVRTGRNRKRERESGAEQSRAEHSIAH